MWKGRACILPDSGLQPGREWNFFNTWCRAPEKYPLDTRADDIWFWQTTLFTADAKALYDKLKVSAYSFISKETVDINANGVYSKSFIVKDPDGHAVLVKEIQK